MVSNVPKVPHNSCAAKCLFPTYRLRAFSLSLGLLAVLHPLVELGHLLHFVIDVLFILVVSQALHTHES